MPREASFPRQLASIDRSPVALFAVRGRWRRWMQCRSATTGPAAAAARSEEATRAQGRASSSRTLRYASLGCRIANVSEQEEVPHRRWTSRRRATTGGWPDAAGWYLPGGNRPDARNLGLASQRRARRGPCRRRASSRRPGSRCCRNARRQEQERQNSGGNSRSKINSARRYRGRRLVPRLAGRCIRPVHVPSRRCEDPGCGTGEQSFQRESAHVCHRFRLTRRAPHFGQCHSPRCVTAATLSRDQIQVSCFRGSVLCCSQD